MISRTRKLALLIATTAVLLMGGVALAATNPIGWVDELARWSKGGLYISTGANFATANQVHNVLFGTITVDFASQTITCVDSSAITVTGAQAGDPCFVGAPTTTGANMAFTCYVSATNNVKVRFCPAGTAADPANGAYNVWVISNQ